MVEKLTISNRKSLNVHTPHREAIIVVLFPLAPLGVLARPSAQPPIDTIGNSLAHLSGRGGGGQFIFENILINFLDISVDSKHFSFFLQKNEKIGEKSNPGRGKERKRKNFITRGHLVP